MQTCAVEGCGRQNHENGAAKGYCRIHYHRARRYGTSYEALHRRIEVHGNEPACDICGSQRGSHLRQWLCDNCNEGAGACL